MVSSEFKFTVNRIERLVAPTEGELSLRDTEVKGLQIRLRSSGAGTYEVRYRVGGGRVPRCAATQLDHASKYRSRRLGGLRPKSSQKRGLDKTRPANDARLRSKPRMKLVPGSRVSSMPTSIISKLTASSLRTKSRHCSGANSLNHSVANAISPPSAALS